MFAIELKKFYWIDDSTDNPDDLCLHGNIAVNIGSEHFETDCTISATALYLLKTITDNHVIYEDNQIFPCCGHFYIPNDTLDNVHISGCPNGIDLSILHVGNDVEITTEQGVKILIDINIYTNAVYAFAERVQSIYENCSPKNIPKDDFDRKGYIAFWNEYTRRLNAAADIYFCPAISGKIDIGLCWEYCFVDNGAPIDTSLKLKKMISDRHNFKNVEDFHVVCGMCHHCQWSK